ncbi:MAG: lytic transglycosylase domain-containing protein [Methylomonas sp.]|jgi:hypothetical protein
MNKVKPSPKPAAKPANRSAPPTGKRRAKSQTRRWRLGFAEFKSGMPWLALEGFSLLTTATLTSMLALGIGASYFTGTDFLANLLPFSLGVVVWIIFAACCLLLWGKLRRRLSLWALPAPAVFALSLACGTVWYIANAGYRPVFTHFRALIGGKAQAARNTLAHQVFAAYRRYNQADLQKMIERSAAYQADITAAAASFDLDLDILMGVAAAESSFLPRDSHDGGKGLFQITAAPKFLLEQARRELDVENLQLQDQRHNAFVAATMLKYYLRQMNGDLFLGLLAYNIGPQNGGLKFIMQQYGADDFISMQPYLQQLPRDYPIRVLSYSLAFRLWRQEGRLLAYQDGDNAVHIQRIGIPGLVNVF